MSFTIWVAVLGAVLLTLALTSSYLRWKPVTTSAVCLALGVGIGPTGLGVLKLDVDDASVWMEHLTEVAVLFSLFVCGLKLRAPFRQKNWRVALGLAGPVMMLSIAGVCLLLHFAFQLPWGSAYWLARSWRRPTLCSRLWCRLTMPATTTVCGLACPARLA